MKRSYKSVIAVADNKNNNNRSSIVVNAKKVTMNNKIYGKIVRQTYNLNSNSTSIAIVFSVIIPKYLNNLRFRCRLAYMNSYMYIDVSGTREPTINYESSVEGFKFYIQSDLYDIFNEMSRLKTDAFRKIYKLSIKDPSIFKTPGIASINADEL